MTKTKPEKSYWFKPKRFGYGATPNTWQGWLSLALFMGLLFWVSFLFNTTWYFFPIIAVLVVCYIIFAKSKTKGDWKWRNG